MKGKASSFADKADVAAFRKAKAMGLSDTDAFKLGDNGIGCYGDNVADDSIPYVAVPPDCMIEKYGSVLGAKHKPVNVTIGNVTHQCIVGDRMPWLKNIHNGAVIDLAPGAQKLFNLNPPFLASCEWTWA